MHMGIYNDHPTRRDGIGVYGLMRRTRPNGRQTLTVTVDMDQTRASSIVFNPHGNTGKALAEAVATALEGKV